MEGIYLKNNDFIIVGLAGGSKSDYVKGLALVAKDSGVRIVVFNQRGLGGIAIKVWNYFQLHGTIENMYV